MGCIPLASFSMSTDGKVWLDQHKQQHPNSSNSADADTSSLTDTYTKLVSVFLPEQTEKGINGSLLSKSLTKPRPPGTISSPPSFSPPSFSCDYLPKTTFPPTSNCPLTDQCNA